MTYLYGLIRADEARGAPRDVIGLDGHRVRVLTPARTRTAAIVSDGERRATSATLDDVRTHDRVLQAFVNGGCTVAATRFGQSFADDAEASDHVERFGDRTARLLDEQAGCVEMRLLLTTPPPAEMAATEPEEAPPTGGPGRAYLDRIRQGLSAPRAERLALRAAIGPVVRLELVEELPRSGGVAFAHLIQRADEAEYRAAVAALPALTEARVIGPLPFYSFAEPAP